MTSPSTPSPAPATTAAEDKGDPAILIAYLVSVAERNGITPQDLDDAVHDLVDDQAALRWANMDDTETGGAEHFTDTDWYADMSERGSQINNDGLEAQIAFLLPAHGPAGTEALLTR